MAERQNWPAWRYGPNGEAQIFTSAGDVPEGWVKHPSRLPPAPEQLPGDAAERGLAEARRIAEAKAADLEAALERIAQLREEVSRLRAENTRLQEKAAIVAPRNVGGAVQSETATVRRPRKLGKDASGTPFTPKDETITVDDGRAERLKVLRAAGITISDDATDGDIEEALDWLEQQPKKD
jgi:hypothetical protein